ncbi:MAG: DUF1638 domain-containing protein [Actinophytocola sp.]|uniref:DUF1638 domain-containing protein n=1 Tax=Actinophytocola sp. TaxID=1872138 RepID=UPI003D6A16F0
MSSSPTARTSTTGSSSSSPSPAEVAVVACGALSTHVTEIAARRGWPVHVHPLPPLLHNRPERIAAAVESALDTLRGYDRVAVAFADCGTYGALDEVCARRGVARLGGAHCYEVFAGAGRLRELLEAEPGTYVLTDFLVRSFRRTVVAELGLDRYPELREDYFRHYRRVVWLAQRPTESLRAKARQAAETLGLPLSIVSVGDEGLERELADLL